MIKQLVYSLLFLVLLGACQSGTPKVKYPQQKKRDSYNEKLLQANRGLVDLDADSIRRFIATKAWQMQEHGLGFWYQITDNGQGTKVEKDKIVSLKYKLSYLDGKEIYSSDSLGTKSFRVGQGGVETGLEDAILLLKVGDKARIILPPHLAHGLTGDNNKIPGRTILLYQLEVLALKEPKPKH